MAKKEEKIANIISIIIIILAGIIIFSFIKPASERAGDVWGGLKGELATLIGPGELLVPEGLVAYYRLDGNARDELGNHDGEVHGAVVMPGVFDRGYEFRSRVRYVPRSGSPDYGSPDYVIDESYINIPFSEGDELDFSNKEEITTSFWMNLHEIPADNAGGSRPLYWEDYPTSHGDYDKIQWFATDNGDGTFSISWRVINQLGNASKITCVKRIKYMEWHMFAGKKDKGMIEVYIDGKFCGAAISYGAIGSTTSGNDWVISDATPNQKLGIVGKMDEVRIYDRALPSSEIALLYLGGLEVNVVRDIDYYSGNYYVILDISTTDLMYNEIMMITEKVPEGVSIVQDNWNAEPAYVFDDTLVWLFANNPPRYYGQINISQEIPSSLFYTVSGSSSGEFRGKWGLKVIDIDGFVEGESTI